VGLQLAPESSPLPVRKRSESSQLLPELLRIRQKELPE
jgi:hypothetical protein